MPRTHASRPTPRSELSRELSPTQSTATDSSETSHSSHGNRMLGDIQLPPDTQQKLMDQINSTVDSVLLSMVGDRPSRVYWRPKGEKKGIAYYVDDSVGPDETRFCCVSETTASTQDLMKLFLMTDTETLLKNNRIVYNNILDARVLGVLQHPTCENPYKSVYVRYSSYAAPKPLDDRDLCLVVATDVFTHEDGSTIGYCLWDSVDLPQCPDYYSTLRLVRGRMTRSGFFFRTTYDVTDPARRATTKIVYLVGMEPGGTAMPRFTAWFLMEKFGANLQRLCNYFRRKHLDPATFRPRAEWPSLRAVHECRACTKPFASGFHPRYHCVACGDVFCRPCVSKDQVDLPGVGLASVRFCRACLDRRGLTTIEPPLPTPATPQPQRRRRSKSRVNSLPELPQLLDSFQSLLPSGWRPDASHGPR